MRNSIHIVQLKRTIGIGGGEIDVCWKDHEVYTDLDKANERFEYFAKCVPDACVRVITVREEKY